jgi:hypothetical protein
MNDANKVEEEIIETDKEVQDEMQESVSEIKEESKALTPQPAKMKKHHEAKKLVEEAKSIVKASESELQDCKLLLEDDLKEYDAAKKALKVGGYDAAKDLLSQLGHGTLTHDEEGEDLVFEAKDDVKPIVLKDVRSGRFTGVILALLGGLATLVALVYWATEKLGMTLDVTKVPNNETMQTIFGWFGTQIGRPNDALNGALVVAAAVLAVMVLIYLLRVWLKGSANLRFATDQMKETQKYITHKSNCKVEMDRVDAHITEAIKVMKDYEILLNEQSGKLKRILHFEGQKGNVSDYHSKSVSEMKDTQNLIENIGRFISTPMSEEGKLSGKSSLFLHSAKETLQKTLEKLS